MTEPRTDLICTVCRGHRAQFKTRKSKLIPSMTLVLCSDCIDLGREPRFAIIMVARDPEQGLVKVRDYIKHHRYVGDKIEAKELI